LIQAVKDYHQRGDVVIIRVVLILPANYPVSQPGAPATACDNTALQQPNFWRNFSFVIKQRGKMLSPSSAKNEPIYSSPTKEPLLALTAPPSLWNSARATWHQNRSQST